ncbi:MAG TPA: MarR family transcriptional regulator [Acidimicrobiales bacterium]|nr:MarR family transcriptional regulator [Acidimicrobiales bacterium]
MPQGPDQGDGGSEQLVDEVAGALQASVRLLVQRLRQSPAIVGDLTSSETSALARLDRAGPATPSGLARLERISPQSMGATLAALEARGLVERAPDSADGRRAIISLTPLGSELLRRRRRARNELLSSALADGFTPAELWQLRTAAPLIERLADKI